MAEALRSTIDKWNLMKLKNFCKAKNTANSTKCQPAVWERSSHQLFLSKLTPFSSAITEQVNSGQQFRLKPISLMPQAVDPGKR